MESRNARSFNEEILELDPRWDHLKRALERVSKGLDSEIREVSAMV